MKKENDLPALVNDKSIQWSTSQIMVDILNLCRQPRTRTQVMFKANLNWARSNEYLSFLQSFGLLQIHNSRVRYETTQKGLQFVEKWKELTELLSQD